MLGKVIFKSAKNFIVYSFDDGKKYVTQIRKKTKANCTILVGDDVEFFQNSNEYVIEKIIEGKNYLIRPKISNVDYIILVYTFKEPDYSSFLLNKFLAYYESRNIENIIIYFSKTDLIKNDEERKFLFNVINSYKKDGYIVYDSLQKDELEKNIKKIINNKVICFAGQSGVGKSTLINFLLPELKLKTQEISMALNRGKHTTTSTLMIPYERGFVVDTPGFSSIDLKLKPNELARSYNDFRLKSVNCKFSDCLHINENGCFIKNEVQSNNISKQRYEDYIKLAKELNK